MTHVRLARALVRRDASVGDGVQTRVIIFVGGRCIVLAAHEFIQTWRIIAFVSLSRETFDLIEQLLIVGLLEFFAIYGT